MTQLRKLRRLLTFTIGLMLAACGSGGGQPGETQLATAALDGLIVEVDGSTVDRSGITVRVVETGDRAVTGPDGRFSFDAVPADGATLEFSTSSARLAIEDELENEADEDESGNPIARGVDGGRIEVVCSLENGRVVSFASQSDSRARARNRLVPVAGSPIAGLDGHAKAERRADRQKLTLEAEHLPAGTLVEFLLDTGDGTGPRSVGTALADLEGEAELEFGTTDGGALPLGAADLADLEGAAVEVRLAADGSILLTGSVPGLPDSLPASGDEPAFGGRGRSRARLTGFVALAEGDVELRSRPEDSEQEFRMEAELGVPNVVVVFQIEDPENSGSWIVLETRVTRTDGEAEFQRKTGDGDTLPLGVDDVSELVGLAVRVTQDTADGGVLLSGTIAPLVAD